jgi:hypothetical protein
MFHSMGVVMNKAAKAEGAGSISGTSIEKKLKAVRLPKFTGQQMNAALTGALPEIMAKREEREARGRKHTYSRERFERVLGHMAAGKTQVAALEAEGLSSSTFWDWTQTGGGSAEEALHCRESLARAKLMLADHAWSEALDVPRQLYAKALEAAEKGTPAIDSAMVSAAKLLTDSLWRYAERLRPGEYAEKGRDVPTVNVTHNSLTISGRDLDAGQRDQLRALLTAAQRGDGPLIEG